MAMKTFTSYLQITDDDKEKFHDEQNNTKSFSTSKFGS